MAESPTIPRAQLEARHQTVLAELGILAVRRQQLDAQWAERMARLAELEQQLAQMPTPAAEPPAAPTPPPPAAPVPTRGAARALRRGAKAGTPPAAANGAAETKATTS